MRREDCILIESLLSSYNHVTFVVLSTRGLPCQKNQALGVTLKIEKIKFIIKFEGFFF